MLELGIKVLAAYFLGSIVGALVVGEFRGVDIRTMGSGNAGGTNALRTQGFAFAAATIVIDVGKGWLAAGWLPALALPGVPADAAVGRDWLAASCAAAAVAGQVWPIWHEFRGGKGGATLAGALLAVSPAVLAIALATWLGVAVLFGFVGLATVAAAVSVPLATAAVAPASAPWLAFGIAMAALVAWAHRSNFARMRDGREPRADKLWLLRRRRRSR
ncbi:MAG TPA: glycerol-3-phosphate acyltransferase [Steroidobacteraceae bacterium]|nr:glycerol-3-phosphate acyltransferase [Steroidobacteraceae bacterium]